AKDFRGLAARADRSVALHIQCECLFLRSGSQRLRLQPRSPWQAPGVHSGVAGLTRRDDVAALSHPISEQDADGHHVLDARREDRTISDRVGVTLHETHVVATPTTYHDPPLRESVTVIPPAASGPSPSLKSTTAIVDVC